MAPRVTIHAVAGLAKVMLNYGCKQVQINGLESFLTILKHHRDGRGIITYCNHISLMDEPTIWGCMPWWSFKHQATTRWTLGASDIMFTNKHLARFFERGQVIETYRGAGIFQPAIDTAIQKLAQGQWVHLFPEGFVNVSTTTTLRRFKWGISRMLIEVEKTPVVVPMWITGFDSIMPEPRPWPKFLPRLGANVSITFGEPIEETLHPVLSSIAEKGEIDPALLPKDFQIGTTKKAMQAGGDGRSPPLKGWPLLRPNSLAALAQAKETAHLSFLRSQLTELLRLEMRDLGRKVRLLNGQQGQGTLCHTATLGKDVHTQSEGKQEAEGRKESAA